VSAGYVPVLGVALEHGPAVAFAAAFALMPGGFLVLARLLEGRWLRPGEEFTAVVYGDPLLAVAAGLGTWLLGGQSPRGLAAAPFGLATAGCWLAFGLAQWRSEVRRGFYTRAQAAAPTKIWHQLVVYPVLGYWLWTAGIGGLTARVTGGGPAGAGAGVGAGVGAGGGSAGWPPAARVAVGVIMVGCVLGWVAANGYDRLHPRLGHPPYDWRRLRQAARPWAPASVSLRAYLDQRAAPAGRLEPESAGRGAPDS
jgi:hypothetical protein